MKAPYYLLVVLAVLLCTVAIGYRLMVPVDTAETAPDQQLSLTNDTSLKPAPNETQPATATTPPPRRGPLIPVESQAGGEQTEDRPDPAERSSRPLIITPVTTDPAEESATTEDASPTDTEPASETATNGPDQATPAQRAATNPDREPTRVLRLREQAAEPGPRTYTVQEGDTFSTISERVYGESRHWVLIARANPTVDPIRLPIGQAILLPELDEDGEPILTEDEEGLRAPEPVQRHVIRPGESLSSISVRYYGTASQWRTIFNANRGSIGSDPNAIRAGMSIVIPSVPVRERDSE
ncbi:LysM peptidoglycan-binding domain-containing protein [Mucisphaera sp.]|uniref:LysM peptidoglycan-binding domain-containing protein n=1 Tax=Mucisphaera sp. TaxID=2913024 RepID=UPI003D09ABF4